MYECVKEEKILKIQTQYRSKKGENRFDDIFKIKISSTNIRQLLLMQSIFHCESSLDVLKLVGMQVNPQIFYKSFLELDRKNMVSILSFDSNSVKSLISDKFSDYFEEEFPIFFMNKQMVESADVMGQYNLVKSCAIDIAIENNQIQAVSCIINHIVKYQNNYVSSQLFKRNMITLLHKGISLSHLLCSNVFIKHLEFEDWPIAHTNLDKIIVPYNGSLFEMRNSYDTIFEGLGDPMNDEDIDCEDHKPKGNKFYSISYKVNILPSVIHDDDGNVKSGVLLESIFDQGEHELSIFESQAIQDLIMFKWNKYAFFVHYLGAIMHIFNVAGLTFYIYSTYLTGIFGEESQQASSFLLCIGLVYPFVYDSYQLYRQKLEYFKDPWNYSDMFFNFFYICNIIFQFKYKPDHLSSQITLSLVLFLALVKSLFFLRIFDNISYLVTLIRSVIYDLRLFMVFYCILMYMLSLIFGVIGLNNFSRNPDQVANLTSVPGSEYSHIGLLLGNMLTIIRISVGDFDFSGSSFLDHKLNIIYWIVWVIIIFIMCIIFLNFIIAEASASYERISGNIENFLLFQKVALIFESEEVMFKSLKTVERFPKYVVVREKEE